MVFFNKFFLIFYLEVLEILRVCLNLNSHEEEFSREFHWKDPS